MALRCVYLDLDGTLLGAGASLLHDGEGRVTLLGARALEACHRSGAEVFLMSGRRRSQVSEPARLIGARAYCFELGGGLVIDGEESWLCGAYSSGEGGTPWERIDATGAPALLLERFAGSLEPHAPWHLGREISHIFRGAVDPAEADAVLREHGLAELRLVDNGELSEDRSQHCYHLVPATASKRGAVELHMRARGLAPEECLAVGDSREDATVGELVGRFALVANAAPDLPGERTEAGHGDGVYEAVVRALAELR